MDPSLKNQNITKSSMVDYSKTDSGRQLEQDQDQDETNLAGLNNQDQRENLMSNSSNENRNENKTKYEAEKEPHNLFDSSLHSNYQMSQTYHQSQKQNPKFHQNSYHQNKPDYISSEIITKDLTNHPLNKFPNKTIPIERGTKYDSYDQDYDDNYYNGNEYYSNGEENEHIDLNVPENNGHHGHGYNHHGYGGIGGNGSQGDDPWSEKLILFLHAMIALFVVVFIVLSIMFTYRHFKKRQERKRFSKNRRGFSPTNSSSSGNGSNGRNYRNRSGHGQGHSNRRPNNFNRNSCAAYTGPLSNSTNSQNRYSNCHCSPAYTNIRNFNSSGSSTQSRNYSSDYEASRRIEREREKLTKENTCIIESNDGNENLQTLETSFLRDDEPGNINDPKILPPPYELDTDGDINDESQRLTSTTATNETGRTDSITIEIEAQSSSDNHSKCLENYHNSKIDQSQNKTAKIEKTKINEILPKHQQSTIPTEMIIPNNSQPLIVNCSKNSVNINMTDSDEDLGEILKAEETIKVGEKGDGNY